MELPTGTVTFLFTDIEGSTRLLHTLGERYSHVLETHAQLVREIVAEAGGLEVNTEGDAFFLVFPDAVQGVKAAVAIQRALFAHQWPTGVEVRVRIGVHTGQGVLGGADYVGAAVHRGARIAAAGHGGQVLLSAEALVLTQKTLPAGVGVRDLGEHRLADFPDPEHLYQLVIRDLPSDFPALRTPEARPNNLPAQLTTFVGRTDELRTVAELLAGSRLVTLIGPGGTGKTRLSIQVGGDLLEDFPAGVWIIELASLADPGLIPQTVAEALGIREQPGIPLTATIAAYVGSKSMLLLLDNCEHLLLGVMRLTQELLTACPRLHVLATSREALGIPGETVHQVLGLAVPQLAPLPPLDELASYEAVQLFIDRARLRRRGFAITPNNAADVAQVCVRLDGMPLAIELAAARVQVLEVGQIAQRLDDRFRLLTGGSAVDVPRQQTLRLTMDWSYGLLDGREATLLRASSVFAGGFSLVAAETVCRSDDVPASDVLDLLQRLVERSLVVAEDRDGSLRYRLIETIREYGQEKLGEADEAGGVRRNHGMFFLAMAEEAEPELQGSGQSSAQAAALDRLEQDHENLRAAVETLAELDAEAAVRLAGALWRFWEVRGYLSEGSESLSQVLSAGDQIAPAVRAKALDGAGRLAWRQGAFAEAKPFFQESLELWRRACDQAGEANALHGLARAAVNVGDYTAAEAWGQESMAIQRQLGNRQGVATALNTLGEVGRARGDTTRAEAMYTDSLAIYRDIGDIAAAVTVRHNLAYTALNQGNVDRAETLFLEALATARDIKDRLGIFSMLGGLAAVAAARGLAERAAELFGAADAVGKTGGYAGDRIDQNEISRNLAAARRALDSDSFDLAWSRGQSMPLDEAIAYALAGSSERAG